MCVAGRCPHGSEPGTARRQQAWFPREREQKLSEKEHMLFLSRAEKQHQISVPGGSQGEETAAQPTEHLLYKKSLSFKSPNLP